MNRKIFPIKNDPACLLKWNHSTVFLPKLTTASCHRVNHHSFDLETFNFHNTPEKIKQREKMLAGQWPGEGCEHCKNIEDVGGTSDRMIHLDMPGFNPPKELESNPTATTVTPKVLEIYFSNTCNLKCIYCSPNLSSQIQQENNKFGNFLQNDVRILKHHLPEEFSSASDKMFEWLDAHVHELDKLMVLGGEPFIQKQTHRLLDFLSQRSLPNLDLVFFSNLTIEHEKFKNYMATLNQLVKSGNIGNINIVGSIDCWGDEAEYIRNGLNLELFEKNFTYVLDNTNFILNINSTLSPLSIKTLPELVEKINTWSQKRIVYWSMMKTGGVRFMHPSIFGNKILDHGFNQALDLYDDMGDPEKTSYKDYFVGIGKEIEQTPENKKFQSELKTYLEELDRRRGTDYKNVFSYIHDMLEHNQ